MHNISKKYYFIRGIRKALKFKKIDTRGLSDFDIHFKMLDKNLEKILKIISRELNSNKILWCLIGSANMYIQGIDVKPNDIDINIQLKDVRKVKNIFSEYNPVMNKLSPLNESDIEKLELKFKIYGKKIQLIGETENGIYASRLLSDNLINIKLDKIEIPCFTLETEAETYRKINRLEKAKLIKDFLESQ
ncbi:MAG: hypothetical protein PVJ67_06845 [Candidatus Pacearchaeota archaeon]|jgi:hypothetical protein